MTKQFTKPTNYHWAVISPFLPVKCKRKLYLCDVMNAILWLLRTHCQWRDLSDEYPHWQAVYYHFDSWKTDGLTVSRISWTENKKNVKHTHLYCVLIVSVLS